MSWTVDLVISGDGPDAHALAIDALRRGVRVLVILRADAKKAQQVRRSLGQAAGATAGRLRVIASGEVVCVDGVDAVEVVVVRYASTGRLVAVNASSYTSFDEPT